MRKIHKPEQRLQDFLELPKKSFDKTYYIYYLLNEKDQIEYVGLTQYPERRLKGHIHNKFNKYYRRYDIRLETTTSHSTFLEAMYEKHRIQKTLWPERLTHLEVKQIAAAKGSSNQPRSGKVLGGKMRWK